MTVPSTTSNTPRGRAPALARRVALAGVIGLAGLAIGAPAALAGKSQTIDTRGGHIEFHHEGERLLARDDRRDGYSVMAELSLVDGLPLYDVVDGDGANSSPNRGRYPLPEGTNVLVRMCYLQNQWNIVSCSRWQPAQA